MEITPKKRPLYLCICVFRMIVFLGALSESRAVFFWQRAANGRPSLWTFSGWSHRRVVNCVVRPGIKCYHIPQWRDIYVCPWGQYAWQAVEGEQAMVTTGVTNGAGWLMDGVSRDRGQQQQQPEDSRLCPTAARASRTHADLRVAKQRGRNNCRLY